MMQAKLSSLVGRSSGYIENLPPAVRRRITGLKGIQKDHGKLEAAFQEEVLQLEKKYFAKFTPLYQQRAEIVNGTVEPTKEQIAAGKAEEGDEKSEEAEVKTEIKTEDKDEDEAETKGIPEFWLSAMKNQVSLAEMINDRDGEVLKHLSDIRMEYLDRPGFRLIFSFAPNDFLANQTLSKTYFYREENGFGGDFIYDHAEGEKIDWKAGKDVTVRVESKKQRNKSRSPIVRKSHANERSYQADPSRQEDRTHRILLQLLQSSQSAQGRRERLERGRYRGALGTGLYHRRGHQGEAHSTCG